MRSPLFALGFGFAGRGDGSFVRAAFYALLCAGIWVILYIELRGELPVQFEWDEDKAALNLKKHGVRFETAALVFNDENQIELFDSAHSLFEERYNTIGKVDEVLFVVYTER